MVKNARRAGCIGSGESRGTIQVGGSHIGRVAACREMEIVQEYKAGRDGGWEGGATTRTTSSQPTTPPFVSSVSELGVGGDSQQSMAKRNDAAAPKLVQRGHAMTRLDSTKDDLNILRPACIITTPGLEPFVVPEKSTNPGHWTPGGGPSSTTPENAWAAWFALEPTPVLFSSGPLIGREPLLIPATVASACPPFTPFRPLLLGRLPASADKRACTEPQSPVHDALYQRNHWPARGN